MKRTFLILGIAVIANSVLAHSDVANPAVKARMDLMTDIRKNTAILGDMAKGKTAFDAEAAQVAQTALKAHTAGINAAFEAKEDDPKSQSKEAIWTEWEKFSEMTGQLDAAIDALDSSSLDGLRAGFGAVGATCSNCHKAFRIKK